MLPNPYPAASDAARHHAEIEWPKESVGIVTHDGEYVPLVNVHAEPEKAFAISDDDALTYQSEAAAVIHSHCLNGAEIDPRDGPFIRGPSLADMQQQAEMACPWGIVTVIDKVSHETVLWWGDSIPVLPLVGRPYIHGIYDCYSAIRDAFRTDEFGFVREFYGQDSILLTDYPRGFGFWRDHDRYGNPQQPVDMYRLNLDTSGFRPINRDELRPGDAFIAQVKGPAIDHAGLYLGGNVIFHHPRRRMSKREPIGRWTEYITAYLRYDPK